MNNRNGETKESIAYHIKNIVAIMVKYLKCTAIDSVLVGVINLVFMLLMKMPFAILISVVVLITNFIPNLGAVLSAVIGGVILCFNEPKMAMWFLIFTAVLQAIDGMFIKPKIYGKSFGMSGIMTLIVMLIGGGLFGVWGMIFSLPVVTIAGYIYENIILPTKITKDS